MTLRFMLGSAVLACVLHGAAVAQEVYDYAVDRFEVDGNVHGPLDGVADLVDDFDDGVMGPTFQALVGGASESGGALHLQSPGLAQAVLGITPVRFDTSAVENAGIVLAPGGGDAVLRATLPAQPVGPNDALTLFVSWYDGDGLHYGGVSFGNLNRSLGDLFAPPIPPGPSVFSHLETIGFPNGQIDSLEPRAVDAGSITGPVTLELRYDDTARTLTPSYSTDGGATFAPSFAPLTVGTWATSLSVHLAAVAYRGECPAGLGIRKAIWKRLGFPGRSRAKLRLAVPQNFQAESMRIVVRDQGAGGAVLVDVQLPDNSPSTPRCDPRDGWYVAGGRRGYRVYGDALPPDCLPGSAQGLRKYDLRWTGTAFVTLMIAETTLPPIVGPIRVEFYHGTGPANSCDGFIGDAACVTGSGNASCSDSP